MHFPVAALPGARTLLLDPAGQAISAQAFGPRSAWWNPGHSFAVSLVTVGLRVKEGSNARMGTATLVAGTVTVNTTAVTANSRVFLTAQTTGAGPGALRISARVAGTSFTITSTNAADTSSVAWMIVEPAP